jgi:uncharacterized membrane protein
VGLISNPATFNIERAHLNGRRARSITQGDTFPMAQSKSVIYSLALIFSARQSLKANQSIYGLFTSLFSYTWTVFEALETSLKNYTDGISISRGVKQHKKRA